jgi:hypothetical protein
VRLRPQSRDARWRLAPCPWHSRPRGGSQRESVRDQLWCRKSRYLP